MDIANNSIHSGDVLDNTINTFDVHSFLGADVVDNSLTGADIDESTLTPTTGVVVREGTHVFAGANESVQADATCQPGEVATRGGFRGDSDARYFGSLRHSLPVPDTPGSVPTGWLVVARGGTQSTSVGAYVLCAKAP